MVKLAAMTEQTFVDYLATAAQDYAAEKVRAGNWSAEEALVRAEQDLKKLLPGGVRSKDQYLFSILDDATSAPLGMIWFAVMRHGPRAQAFIYDFIIDEAHRRRGYGRQAMLAVEQEVKKLGLDTISLHVFGHNHAARALYEQLGYETTNINMSKKLGGQGN